MFIGSRLYYYRGLDFWLRHLLGEANLYIQIVKNVMYKQWLIGEPSSFCCHYFKINYTVETKKQELSALASC